MAPKSNNKPAKKGKPPPIEKLIIPAIGIGLALLGYQFIRGLSGEIQRINIHDEYDIREVFYGEAGTGNSYVVLCHEEGSTLPISSVFQDAYKEVKIPTTQFRILDCNKPIPSLSDKSTIENFKFNTKTRPTIFLTGAVIGNPQQVPEKHLKTGSMLAKLIRGKIEGRAAKIETTQDLRTKCLNKNLCGLLLKGSKKAPQYVKDAMSKLMKEYPKVSFASIDSSVLYLKNVEAEYLPELSGEQPRFVVFQKVSGSLDAGGDRLISSLASLPTNGMSYGQVSTLIADIVRGNQPMTKLPALPIVKTRTKKLEQEEKAKRERKLDQQRRQQEKAQQQQQQQQSGAAGGAFQSNDGSREGRRAERERRRQEHYANNNVRPKTPEEIAEMERRRRERMAEEAEKWNIAPEDAPEEGDPIYDDDIDLGDVMEEIVDYDDNDQDGQEGESSSGGEEVIDLD